MAALPFESDDFQALLDETEVFLDLQYAAGREAGGVHFDAYCAMMANMLIIRGENLIAGQLPKRGAARKIAHNLYSTNVRTPRRRETTNERVVREAKALGMYKGAA